MIGRLITVTLDRPRQIAFTQLALYRMGTLPRPFELDEVDKPRTGFAALVAWLWAMLGPEDAKDFPTPEDLAQHVSMKATAREPLINAFAEAINAATSQGKNGDGSTPKPSPSSSSASPVKRSGR